MENTEQKERIDNMKRTMAILLALIMVFALAAPVMASGSGQITVNDAVEGQIYSIYRIFDLESFDASKGTNAFAYKVNSDWNTFISSEAAKAYISVDEQGYVTWKTGDDQAAAFAKLALAYANANNIAAVASKTAEDATVVFTGLDYGYYLVDSSLGALCALNTTKPNATVNEKNSAPTLEKKVLNGTAWGDSTTANRGEEVNFLITVTVGKGAENYTIHDYMNGELKFKGIKSVKLNGADVSADSYQLVTAPTCGEKEGTIPCTFEIRFTKAFCESLNQGDVITVEYSAINNKGAGTVENYSNLGYGDGNTTVVDKVEVKTYSFLIVKWDGRYDIDIEKADDAVLYTAEFQLYDQAVGGTAIQFIARSQAEIDACWKVGQFQSLRYTVWNESVDAEQGLTKTDTIMAGFSEIQGLKAGTYYLEEVQAPDGFNKIAGRIAININDNGVATIDGKVGSLVVDGDTPVFAIVNNTGAELPSTGGIGTTIFYVVGGILMLGAAVILVTRKKVSSSK